MSGDRYGTQHFRMCRRCLYLTSCDIFALVAIAILPETQYSKDISSTSLKVALVIVVHISIFFYSL